ncbi:uncharacterized protein LOC116263663 [Nymphaea colorata]|nr:uncharacterized protein LOC116263663 [Nymphaea colorata]
MYVGDANISIPQSFKKFFQKNVGAIPNPQRFKLMLISSFNDLIVSVITNPLGRFYWGDSFKYTQNLTIYAMAQCLQNLSPKSCKSCLDGAVALMLKDVASSTGGIVLYNLECYVGYDIFPFFAPPPHKIPPSSAIFISTNCSPPASSNKVGSPFHRNLKALLNHLIVHAPFSGFYNDTDGLDSSQVYGQAFCRGDVLRDVCWYCIAQASIKIQELCPNSERAIIWLDRCQLRYSDENFAGKVDVYDRACQPAAENASNPVIFDQNLRILISNLTSLAVQSSPIRFFATGTSVPMDSQKIYALVQCVIDIPADQCGWCLQNASSDIEGCSNGKQGGRILRGSCSLAFGVQPFFLGNPIFVSLPQPNHGHHRRWIFIVICFIGGLVLLTTGCLFCLVQKRKQHPESEATLVDSESAEENMATYDLPHFSLRTIEDATDTFSESNKLGEGGYGPVYKGNLRDGQEVAVKRLSGRSRQGFKEFRNEVELIAKLQQTNLVRLVGCPLEKGEKILIYEYVPNKSLDFFLQDPKRRASLDWEKRFNIIKGIARGMLYLHQDSRLNIIHRDLKASNVLLDDQLHPKISDFGLARIFNGGQGQAITGVIVGTYGYMAPEYAMGGVFSTKSDVYSFGILLLEIIRGRLNSASICSTHDQRYDLVEHAWSLWCEEKGTEFIDPFLKDGASTSDQMLRCLHIGFLCIQEHAATRPTMSRVVLMLGNVSFVLPLPTQPAVIGENAAESSVRRSSFIRPVASEGSTSTNGNIAYEVIGIRPTYEQIFTSIDGQAWSLWCEGKGTEFIDPVFKDAATSTSNQMLRCLHIGFLCIQEDPATRPTMSTVVLMLGNDSVDLPLPTQSASFGENVVDSSRRCSSVITSVASEITTRFELILAKRVLVNVSLNFYPRRKLSELEVVSSSSFVSQSCLEEFYHRLHGGEAMCRTASSFVFLIALLLPPGLVNMAENPNWICLGSSNYIANSTFVHNLEQALAFLVANVSFTGFYNVTVGKSLDQVIAAAECRGDLDGEACEVCVSYAASQVALRCPKNKAAAIFIHGCVMYVGDANVSIPQSFKNACVPTVGAIPNPQRFKLILASFFNDLIVSAITNPLGRLYWGDSFKYTQNLTIYAMAQCLQRLSPRSCKSCLDGAVALMLKDVAFSEGATAMYNLECFANYGIFPSFAPPLHKIPPSSAIFISTNCSPPASSNKVGSPFHRNLKALLNHLIVRAPLSGSYSDTVGLGSSQVYGQAFCRGDVLREVCWYCIAQASIKIQELCPNSERAIIWLDRCQLRYSDENFAGKVDGYDRACQPAAENASNPVIFDQNLRILISNLTSLAVQSSPNRFFATGTSVPMDSQKIYALVQCVIDIPADQCGWCLQNASSDIEGCSNGKQGGRILRGSCSLAFGVQPFFLGNPIFVSLPQPNHGHHRRWIFVVICFIGGLVLLTTGCLFCLVQKRKQDPDKLKKSEATLVDSESAEENEATYDLPHFSLRTIEDATDIFSESNKLGEGGYGPVYKGNLRDGQEVAVKRLSGRSRQGFKEFRNEVELIAKLQHTNLVRLVGCCLEKGEKILIYEYVPNKSLDFFLKDPKRRASLDWEKRFNIIKGIAKGMLYLHQDSRLNIIHRDLKASNVLLDDQLHPKISDFGLARIFDGGQGQAITRVVVGTYGYMAPEYAMGGVFSTKSDVYSFGILLLEIISGRLNSASICSTHDQHYGLVENAWSMWCEEKGTEFIDPFLKDGTSTSDQMLRCLHIGFLCIQEDAATRPTMSRVVLMLGNDSFVLPLPTQPAVIGENAAESSVRRYSFIRPVASEGSTRSLHSCLSHVSE